MSNLDFKLPEFRINQVVTFNYPSIGRVKGKIINIEYSKQMSTTVLVLIENHGLMQIHQSFLMKLVEGAK